MCTFTSQNDVITQPELHLSEELLETLKERNGETEQEPISEDKKSELNPEYNEERELLRDVLMSTGMISHSAIICMKDKTLQAHGPDDFIPNPDNVSDIIRAFHGDIMGLADNGVDLGGGLPIYIPGKILEGRIACSDGLGGGCVLYDTKLSVIIVVFQKDVAVATRLGFKVADHLRKKGR